MSARQKRQGGQPIAEAGKQLGRIALAQVRVEGRLIIGQMIVGLEEIGEGQDVAGHLDAVAGRGDELFNDLLLLWRRRRGSQAGLLQKGTRQSDFVLG